MHWISQQLFFCPSEAQLAQWCKKRFGGPINDIMCYYILDIGFIIE